MPFTDDNEVYMVCPHCELSSDAPMSIPPRGTHICEHCGMEYVYSRILRVTYETEVMEW